MSCLASAIALSAPASATASWAPPCDSRIAIRSQEATRSVCVLHQKINRERMQLDVPATLIRTLGGQFTEADDPAGKPSRLLEQKIAQFGVGQFRKIEP